MLLIWNYEVIVADHDGYCTGDENVETIYNEKYGVLYHVNDIEYNLVKWLYNHGKYIDAIPETILIDIDYHGTGYCIPSKHGLSHVIMKTPINIEKILNINEWSPRKNKTIVYKKNTLHDYLNYILKIKNVVYVCMKDILPYDMINLILLYVF